jgi:hypothetical protein
MNAWKFPKFHELLHILDDMPRIGSPVNFCALRPAESLLISAANIPEIVRKRELRILHVNFRQPNVWCTLS